MSAGKRGPMNRDNLIDDLNQRDETIAELRAELAGLRNEYVEVVDELAASKHDWNTAPEWAIGSITYRDGGEYWISNNGLRLKEYRPENKQ